MSQLQYGLIFPPQHCDDATALKNHIQQELVLVPIPEAYAIYSFLGCRGPQNFAKVEQSHIAVQPNIKIFPDTSNVPFAPQIVFQIRAHANIPLGQAFCYGKLISRENNPVAQEMLTISFSLRDLFCANATGKKMLYIFKTIEDGLVFCFSISLVQDVALSSIFYQNLTQLETNILQSCPEKYKKNVILNNGKLFVGTDIPEILNKLRDQRQGDLVECMCKLAGNPNSVLEWKLKACRICVGRNPLEVDMTQINLMRQFYDKLTQNNSACLLIFVLGSLLMDLAQINGAELSVNDIDACVKSIQNKMPQILQHSNLTDIYDDHVHREMMCNVRYTADANWKISIEEKETEADALSDGTLEDEHAQWHASQDAGEDQTGESGMCMFNVLQSLLGGSAYETFDDCETLYANFGFLLTSIFVMNSRAEFEMLMHDCLQNLHEAFPSSLDAVIQYQKLASEIITLGLAVYEQQSQKMSTKMQPETHTHEEIHQKIENLFKLQAESPTQSLHDFFVENPNTKWIKHLSSLLASSASLTTDVEDHKADHVITDSNLTFPDYTSNWISKMESPNGHNSPQGHACGLEFCQHDIATYVVNGRTLWIGVCEPDKVHEATSYAKQCRQHVTQLVYGNNLSELETRAKTTVGDRKMSMQNSLNLANLFLGNRAQSELSKKLGLHVILNSTQNWEPPTIYAAVCDKTFYKTAIQCGNYFCFTASKNLKTKNDDANQAQIYPAIQLYPGIALDRRIKNSMPITVSPETKKEEEVLLEMLAHFRATFAIKYAEMPNCPQLSLLTNRVRLQSRDGLLFALDAKNTLEKREKSFTLHVPKQINTFDIGSCMNNLWQSSCTRALWTRNSFYVECV